MVCGRLPEWFFLEGLAVIVSLDERYLTFPTGEYPDVALPHSFKEWRRRTSLEHTKRFVTTTFKVAQRMGHNGGFIEVRAARQALANGEVVDFEK